jgi:hypothetical protein
MTFCVVLAMLRSSFRSVAALLLPEKGPHKQLILALVLLLVAGCGGSKHPAPTTKVVRGSVDGQGFRFEAPFAWKVARTPRSVSAASGAQLVSVTVLPLSRPFRPELRKQVAKELDLRIAQLGGSLRSVGTAVVDGRWARVYELQDGDRLRRLLFLFRGRLEYQLLCQFGKDETRPCERLASTFRLA